jgi:flavin-dependent dehydrogenase
VTLDVAVVGGGPAGSVCAARLAARGRRVALVERARHPRFHLGESLLPASMAVLGEVGVLEEARERFLVKRGARFVDGRRGERTVRYAFAEAFHARCDHALQVPRDAFDELLFRRAGACGAELHEGWDATRVVFEGPRGVVEARGPDGRVQTIEARLVVDATGREAMIARAAQGTERIAHLDKTAIFTQVRGAWRDTAEREGDIQIVVMPGPAPWWFWLIPFADGRTSVGAVVSPAWLREQGRATSPEALFDAAVAESPTVSGMLAGATRLFAPRATADFSFRLATHRGPGWLAVGDAAGFIDPLFSTGAHLAMHGALRAADAIDAALADGDVAPGRFDAWEREVRRGADLYLGAVQAFYAGDLTDYLFADPQHPFLRRAITTMLAGDVFDDTAPWARALRSRFPVAPRLPSPSRG